MYAKFKIISYATLIALVAGCSGARFEQRLQQSQTLIDQGNFADAREELGRLTSAQPDNPDALYLLGTVNARLGRYEESIINYEQAERSGILPTAAFYLDRGVALFHTGRTQEAHTAFEASIRIQPSGQAQRYLGMIRYRRGDFAGAVHAFERSGIITDDREALPMFGISLLRTGRSVDAADILFRANTLLPGDDRVTFETGNALLLAGQPEQAIDLYEQVPSSSPLFLDSIYNRGEANLRLGAFEDAAAQFESYLEQRPADHAARFNLASALIETGEYVIAEELFSELLDVESYRIRAEYNLALTNYRMGRIAEAVVYFSRAVMSDPDNIAYRYAFGLALAESGDIDGAALQMETILADAPGNADALAWLERHNRR